MNSFQRHLSHPSFNMLLLAILLSVAAQAALGQDENAPEEAAAPGKVYEVDYQARFDPGLGMVHMKVTVRQDRWLLRRVRFTADPERYSGFESEQDLVVEEGRVTWIPAENGGTLRYSVQLDNQRENLFFDSLMKPDWAVFRGDDLLPPAKTKALKGARSRSRLSFSGPSGWSYVTAYPHEKRKSKWYRVNWPDRKFDRPIGWMAAGDLGVRWEDIGRTRLAIAGPTDQGLRRLDMVAFLRWNLPALIEVFPQLPDRILVVSAGDPMWRGGLSGPNSIYIHADRPLISGNGTSTLLHEFVHLGQQFRAAKGEDWIIESMAEYYTLEIMRRSGTLSSKRFQKGLDQLASWSSHADSLEADESSGSRTAKGVAILNALDLEMREISDNKVSLDDVARALSEQGGVVDLERLRQVAESLAGKPLAALPPPD